MDPTLIASTAASVVSLLVPFLTGAGKGLAEKAGEETGKAAIKGAVETTTAALHSLVAARLHPAPEANTALADFTQTPDDPDLQAALRVQLRKALQADEQFASQVAGLLREADRVGADAVFNTNIHGDVEKLVNIGTVHGDVSF
jgi:predicted membrane-bound mannosyltransferase